MARKKTVFNRDWVDPLVNPEWSRIFSEVPGDIYKIRCKLCNKSFGLSNMGRQAITSHIKGNKHAKNVLKLKGCSLDRFAKPTTGSTSETTIVIDLDADDNSNIQSSQNQHNGAENSSTSANTLSSLREFTTGADVIDAEILWAMNVIMCHMSYSSCDNSIPVMKAMFKDSKIAENITLGRTKIAYMTTYGLALYFRDRLEDILKKCDKCVICFDEALNKVVQRGQMDIIVRCYNEDGLVINRYLTSVFLQHATAADLLVKFKEGIKPISLNRILQVSFVS